MTPSLKSCLDTQQANTLPSELLREVFLELAFYEYFHIMDEGHARRAPHRTAITVSHVSQYWRNAAISCQQLWSTALPCASLEWTKTCLSRCFSAPFEFAVSGLDLHSSEEYRSAYDLVLPHLARARSVAFELDVEHGLENDTFPSEALRDLLSRLTTTVLPYAKELAVFHSVEYQTLEGITKLDFSKTMPALDVIFLRGIVYAAPSSGQRNIFPANLRELILTDSNFWWTVDEMVEILHTIPMLEVLKHITEPITFTHGVVPKPSRVYPLRCVELKKLRLLVCSCGSFARNMLLFSYLSFPSKASIEITYPHSHPYWIMDAHSSSPTEVADILPLGEIAVREHFAAAITQGALYPDVVLDSVSVAVDNEFYIAYDSRKPVLPFGTDARHLLPVSIKLDVPQVGDEFRTHQRHPHEPRPFHDSLFEMWVSLPFFSNTSTLHLNPDFDHFSLRFLERFSLVREVHFASLYMLGGPFSDMIINDHPNHARGLFPMLTVIHVECTGDQASSNEPGSKDDLRRFEELADTILITWGSLKQLVLHNPERLVDRTATLALLERRFGADRIVCTDNKESTPNCSCYTGDRQMLKMSARPHDDSDEVGSDEETSEDDSGDDQNGGGSGEEA